MATPLSSYVLTYNSARHLARVLAQLKRVADEVIVADSGSTDQTVAIARAAGCRVETRPFTDFGEQRNWALSLCTHDYVLFPDSDEIMSDALVETLLAMKERGLDRECYLIRRETFICGQMVHTFYPSISPDYQIRLFRRSVASYAPTHRVHELAVGIRDAECIDATIEHQAATDFAELEHKLQLYTDLAAADIADRGGAPWLMTLQALTRGPFAFMKWYGGRGGWRDGRLGLRLGNFAYRYTYLKYLKARRLVQARRAAAPASRAAGVSAARKT